MQVFIPYVKRKCDDLFESLKERSTANPSGVSVIKPFCPPVHALTFILRTSLDPVSVHYLTFNAKFVRGCGLGSNCSVAMKY